MTELAGLTPTLLAVALLMAVSAGVLTGSRVLHAWAPALAILRGAAQLAAVSLILGAVITSSAWVAVALGVMFLVATATATRRLGWSWSHLAMAGSSMAAGIVVALAVVFATGSIRTDQPLCTGSRWHRHRQLDDNRCAGRPPLQRGRD